MEFTNSIHISGFITYRPDITKMTKVANKEMCFFWIQQNFTRNNGTEDYSFIKKFRVCVYEQDLIQRIKEIVKNDKQVFVNLNGSLETSKNKESYIRALAMEVLAEYKDTLVKKENKGE